MQKIADARGDILPPCQTTFHGIFNSFRKSDVKGDDNVRQNVPLKQDAQAHNQEAEWKTALDASNAEVATMKVKSEELKAVLDAAEDALLREKLENPPKEEVSAEAGSKNGEREGGEEPAPTTDEHRDEGRLLQQGKRSFPML